MNDKYKLFKPGQTVVDLGYAPGSWSQVAASLTSPPTTSQRGRVIGIDIIPAQPPRGVSTIQGNFLSPTVQAEVRAYVQDPERGRPRKRVVLSRHKYSEEREEREPTEVDDEDGVTEEDLDEVERGYIDFERRLKLDERDSLSSPTSSSSSSPSPTDSESSTTSEAPQPEPKLSLKQRDEQAGRVVDVILSDMSEPWEQTSGFYKRSVSDPYFRMMNTSGMAFRDHAGSMDLCNAALTFAHDTLRTGGYFVCKFYQGAEDKALEKQLRRLFEKVHREKPDSSRKESKEAYFVALRRKEEPSRDEVFQE